MTTCDAVLADQPNGLQCTQPAGHSHGHVYVAAWLADGHHDDITQEED